MGARDGAGRQGPRRPSAHPPVRGARVPRRDPQLEPGEAQAARTWSARTPTEVDSRPAPPGLLTAKLVGATVVAAAPGGGPRSSAQCGQSVRRISPGGRPRDVARRLWRWLWAVRRDAAADGLCPLCDSPVVVLPDRMLRGWAPMMAPRTRAELIAACTVHGRPPYNDATVAQQRRGEA